MMKRIILLCALLFVQISFGQIGIGTTSPKATLDVEGEPSMTTKTDGFIPPRITRAQLINKTGYGSDQKGTLIYVTDTSGVNNAQTANITEIGYYYYNGLVWKSLGGSSGIDSSETTTTTYETIVLSTTDQLLLRDSDTNIVNIPIRDPDKIIGITLISNLHALGTERMSGTWMIGENREHIRCYIQTLHHVFLKFIVVTAFINESTNELTLYNYTTRYIKADATFPQPQLSENQHIYRLNKVVIIREE